MSPTEIGLAGKPHRKVQYQSIIRNLINLNLALAQLHLGLFNLLLQLLVRLGNVVKGKDGEAKTTEEVTSENNDRVEGEL